ncbi:LOW QUALITY PROTEIN: hypothetical protein ACHAWF_001534 [Thalassiosira exigua]
MTTKLPLGTTATSGGRRKWRLRMAFLAPLLAPPLAFQYGQLARLHRLYGRTVMVDNPPLPSRPPPRSPQNASGSSLLLLREAQRHRTVFDEDINVEAEAERCKRYGLEYGGRTTRRRVFFGGLIADDSMGTIAMTAIENYGIFHTVAFIESNHEDSSKIAVRSGVKEFASLQGGMFGPDTKVTVDQYVNENVLPYGLGREHHQRASVLERWKANGMTKDDIGYLADVDEMFSRDFLRAAQICHIKELDDHGNCSNPKLGASVLVFEGGPRCLTKRLGYHPDIIIGECIGGIGNSSMHATPKRTLKGLGWLKDGYSKPSKFSKLPNDTTHFPLYNGADFRRTGGRLYGGWELHAGYHFHNFFPDARALRNKYFTYGHPVGEAMRMNLSEIHEDIKSLVYCGLNLTEEPGTQYPLIEWDLSSIKDGPVPLAFKVPGYVDARMEELREILETDGVLF